MLSIKAEEDFVYSKFSRSVVTAINFFSMFYFSCAKEAEEAEEDEKEKESSSFASFGKQYEERNIHREHGLMLQEYVKTILKDLRKNVLVNPLMIQRKMYWFMSKLIEYGILKERFGHVLAFYNMSVLELDILE